MRIHSGEKPFPCNLCNYRARTRNNLRQHQQRCKKRKVGPLKVIKESEKTSDQQKLENGDNTEATRKWLSTYEGQVELSGVLKVEITDSPCQL